MTAISVVIPVYNSSNYLRQCLDSLLLQTFEDFQIIAVDDGSTDDSYDVLEEYAKRDHRIEALAKDHSNAGDARNIGMDHAKGDYLLFFDSDDFASPDFLNSMYSRASDTDSDVVICRSDRFDDAAKTIEPLPWTLRDVNTDDIDSAVGLKDIIFQICNGWPWDKLFRRQFVTDLGLEFQSLSSTNDAYFVYAALCSAQRITYVDEVLVHHRANNPDSIESRRHKSWENAFQAIHAIGHRLKTYGLYDLFEISYENWLADYLRWSFSTSDDETCEKMRPRITELFSDMADRDAATFHEDADYDFVQSVTMPWPQLVKANLGHMSERQTLEDEIFLLKQQNDLLEHRISEMEKETQNVQDRLEEVVNSTGYKVGRFATYIPRTLKRKVMERR